MTIYRSALPDIEIPDLSITAYVLQQAERLAHHPAFVEGLTGRVVTYGQLVDRIERLAGGLQARGVGPGTDTGEDVAPGTAGELWIRGPQAMKGYLNNPAATAATIDAAGWLHTGDVARIDAHGHTFIVDRLEELIKYKGFQVPPAELEALLITHPGVADVAVIGVPDDAAGEVPKAFIVRAPGVTVKDADLTALVAAHLAPYKQVRIFEYTDTIPKSASGKILRRELRP